MRSIVRGLAALTTTLLIVGCSGGGGTPTSPTGGDATPASQVCDEPTDAAAPADVEALVANNQWGPVGAKVGEVVTWTNDDSVPHKVVLDDNSCSMDGNIAGGGTRSLIFSEAGIFAFHCGVHASMKGNIVIGS